MTIAMLQRQSDLFGSHQPLTSLLVGAGTAMIALTTITLVMTLGAASRVPRQRLWHRLAVEV